VGKGGFKAWYRNVLTLLMLIVATNRNSANSKNSNTLCYMYTECQFKVMSAFT